ncbi:AraC family transcriptional regulator [Aquabacterium humicola]|uniref:AraC family transcriptional regulator n=1 Tax=Aquabacterium humicola TaxID=3237377 RepID=UPI0025439CED|nr:helix-turn-helix transcriptional regulator [Rubrivivax pictus]
MARFIRPEQLPDWVPTGVLASSEPLDWRGLAYRAYRHPACDVEVPGMTDFLVIGHRSACHAIHRRTEGRWSRVAVVPGDLSLLTRGEASHWHWAQPMDVQHVYLSERVLNDVAQEVFERDVADIRLHDLLKVDDPAIARCLQALAQEAARPAPGSALCADAIGVELSVHLLRRFARVAWSERATDGGLSPTQRRRLEALVEQSLHEALTLAQLAAAAHLGVSSFARRFRASYGDSPHAWLVKRRVARARQLLGAGALSLKEVALACGFADQAHLTRTVRAHLKTTPRALQRGA